MSGEIYPDLNGWVFIIMERKNFLKHFDHEKLIKEIQTFSYNKSIFNINNSCLIVTDMQEYFLNKKSQAYIPSSEEIIKPINKLISYFYKYNKSVIFTKHINTEKNAGMMKQRFKKLINENDPLSRISNSIDQTNSILLTKSQFDAFYKTELENILGSEHIDSIVIVGVMAERCVETTARQAFVRGYNVFIPINAIATYYEQVYISSIISVANSVSDIIQSGDIID